MYNPGNGNVSGIGNASNVNSSNSNTNSTNNNTTTSLNNNNPNNSSNSSCVLYLGAIPYNWDVEVIKSVVCGSGPVVDVRCMMDNASKNKGFCFVEYSSSQAAAEALSLLSKIKIEGRKKLRIELSKEGLRNPVPSQKPELHLNRNFLPSNVIIPQEMLLSNLSRPPIKGSNYNMSSSMGSGLPGSKTGNTASAEISAIMASNSQIQQMVSQMIANGMDMNQISAVVKQLTRSSQSQQAPMMQASINSAASAPNSVNAPVNGSSNAAAVAVSAASPANAPSSNGMPTSLSMASQFLPLPQQAPQQAIYAKDKVSETLASIPPGILIELLAKLKLVMSGPSPNYAQAATILHDNPKLAAAAAQSLLLMGIIDMDVINETMSGHFAVSGFDSRASANSSSSSSNSTPANVASTVANVADVNGAYFSSTHHNPAIANPSSSVAVNNASAPTPVTTTTTSNSAKPINPDWLSFPQHTISKLLGIGEQEANLIVQVLKLSPQQIENLPENERMMANQIRAQYLQPQGQPQRVPQRVPQSQPASNQVPSTPEPSVSPQNPQNPQNTQNTQNAPRIFTISTNLPINVNNIGGVVPVLNAAGVPFSAVIENVMEFFETTGPAKKKRHFTQEAIQQLKAVHPADLPANETDKRCAICFEPFDDYDSTGVDTVTGTTTSTSLKNYPSLPPMMQGYDLQDPPISFPVDETASTESHYDVGHEDVIKKQEAAQVKASKKTMVNEHYAVKLPQCDHVFGRSCIVEWLKSNVSCPLCRREVVPEMSEDNDSGRSNLIFYPVALTEIFIPIDWTGPANTGYRMDDPPVNFPAAGDGFSSGRRTGPPPNQPQPHQ
ncbi:hypothetical protein FOA43_002818 [Brettanomyces nanus]|uniref:Uncharacterized protein n=1 Tax=Eeniella nana TaxID=13502 RepID=A0A875S3J4_EENNA|nr:uncharacterized protein FOA43_002818 [Brettanomyces nanus]QPG75463.1 hypothetical protein FOA43_002818 [Brettanomyces nanus]